MQQPPMRALLAAAPALCWPPGPGLFALGSMTAGSGSTPMVGAHCWATKEAVIGWVWRRCEPPVATTMAAAGPPRAPPVDVCLFGQRRIGGCRGTRVGYRRRACPLAGSARARFAGLPLVPPHRRLARPRLRPLSGCSGFARSRPPPGRGGGPALAPCPPPAGTHARPPLSPSVRIAMAMSRSPWKSR